MRRLSAAAETRSVSVLGGGSLGSLFASHFARSRVPTTLLLRPQAAQLVGSRCTISLTEEESDAVDEQTLPCEPANGSGDPFDILVVAVKAFDAQSAIEAVRDRVAETTTVVLMCNGALSVADDLPLDSSQLLIATTTHGAWSRGARDVHHAGKGSTWLGALPRVGKPAAGLSWFLSEPPAICTEPLPPHVQAAQELVATRGLGAIAEEPAATERRLWLKLAANAVLNPLTALWDVQNGEVLRRPKGREISQSVCEELWSVMQDQAISPLAHEITVGDLTDFVSECAEANALNYSSMCMDVRNGRRTEIEQLNGWIERLSHTLHEGGKPLSTAKHWLGKNAELAAAIRRRGEG